MRVLINLRYIYPDLPIIERRVADYILKKYEDVPFESVSDIARHTGVSAPSVTRLTKRLGFKSFKAFKIALAVSTVQSVGVEEVYASISNEDPDDTIIEKTFAGNIHLLKETAKELHKEQLSELATLLANADRVLFIGQGSSGILAEEAALRFAHLDIQSESYTDAIQQLLQAKRLKRGQLCIGITHSGRTSLVGDCLEIARTNQAITAVITNYVHSPILKNCSFILGTSFDEQSVKAAALSSRVAQMAILDALYLLTVKKKQIIWDISEIDRLLEQHLRTTHIDLP